MSEVEAHYRTDPNAPRPGGTGPASSPKDDGSTLGRLRGVGDSAARVKDTAARAAGSVRDAVGQAYESTTGWASDQVDTASRNLTYARRRSAGELNRGRRQVESFVDENPVMIGVAGFAAGLLIGALLPRTQSEDRYLGHYADEVKNQGFRYAQDVVEQGRNILEENLKGLQQAGQGERPAGPAPRRGA